MNTNRIPASSLIGKVIVSKTGKRFGEVADIIFDVRTGELLNIIVKNPTSYAKSLDLERDREGNLLIPFTAVIAIGDFIIISEEDII